MEKAERPATAPAVEKTPEKKENAMAMGPPAPTSLSFIKAIKEKARRNFTETLRDGSLDKSLAQVTCR